jgi:hypothetical protein
VRECACHKQVWFLCHRRKPTVIQRDDAAEAVPHIERRRDHLARAANPVCVAHSRTDGFDRRIEIEVHSSVGACWFVKARPALQSTLVRRQ